MRVTLIDILMSYSIALTPAQTETRRAALLEMNAAQLEAEAKEFCGGAPWAEWLETQAVKAWLARDAEQITLKDLLEVAVLYPNLPEGMADAALEYQRGQRIAFEDLGTGAATDWVKKARR